MKKTKLMILLLLVSTLTAGNFPFEGCFLPEKREFSCYDIEGKRIALNPGDYISCFALSHDKQYFAAASRYDIVVYDMYTNKVTHSFSFSSIKGRSSPDRNESRDSEEFVQFLEFSADGKYLVARRKLEVVAWNLETGKLVGEGCFNKISDVFHVIATSDGRSFILGRSFLGSSFVMVDIETKEIVFEESWVRWAKGFSLQRVEGKYYIAHYTWEGRVELFDVEKKECIARKLSDHTEFIALTPDGRDIVFPIDNANGYCVAVWNVFEDKVEEVGNGLNGGYVNGFALSPDGQTVAVDSFDDVIRVYDLKSCTFKGKSELQTTFWSNKSGCAIGPNKASKIQFSPDGEFILSYITRYLYSSCNYEFSSYPFCLWQTFSGKFIQRFRSTYRKSLQFIDGGKKLIGHDETFIVFFRLVTEKDFERLSNQQMEILWLLSEDRARLELDNDLFKEYEKLPGKLKCLVDATRLRYLR